MAKLMLPSPLMCLLPDSERGSVARDLAAATWTEFVSELRARFPTLANRIITEADALSSGYALVINDEVTQSHLAPSLTFDSSDQILVIAALAGG